MSQIIRNHVKKASFTVAAAIILTAGAMAPFGYLKAETVNTVTQDSKPGMKIGDTTVIFNGVKEAPKGHTGFIMTLTIERAKGIPVEANSMMLFGRGSVVIKGKKYAIDLGGSTDYKRISDTMVKADISVIPIENVEKDPVPTKDITPTTLKGQKVDFEMNMIKFSCEKSTYTEEFANLLKDVKTMTGVPVVISEKEKALPHVEVKNRLPKKGLNVLLTEGSNIVVDNIGFIDNELQIACTSNKDEFCIIDFVDQNGKDIESRTRSSEEEELNIYKIKDMATLSKCKVKVETVKKVLVEGDIKNMIKGSFTF